MKGKRMLLAVVAVSLSSGALASEIYKWTDENGNVHYVDRPSGQPTEERLDVLSNRTNNEAVRASIQARLDRQSTREEDRAQRAEAKQQADKDRAAREKRQEQCDKYRARMENYLAANRLYREDESGERVYLNDTEIDEARAKVQEKIQETCN